MTYKAISTIPVVMSFSALDPSGGSGLSADIEALGAMGCHCVPIATTITAQDTTGVFQIYPCPSPLVHAQAQAILEDIPVAAIKIGAVSSVETLRVIHQFLNQYPKLPLVLDPSIFANFTLKHNKSLLEALIALILPRVTVCAINALEAKMMAQEADTLDACAQSIMSHGVDYLLITGSSHYPNKLANTFYGNYRKLEVFRWDRLNFEFQGSGCTLSACIAGLLAQGLSPTSAVLQAQEYTSECLKNGFRIGMGRHVPNRLYWARGTTLDFDSQKESNITDKTKTILVRNKS